VVKEKVRELWGRLAAGKAIAPFLTCDAVLAEARSFFPDPSSLSRLVARAPFEKGGVGSARRSGPKIQATLSPL
jgi:hypothetical protein